MRHKIILLMAVGSWPLAMEARSPELIQAAMNDDAVAVRALIQQKADINATAPDGTTALHYAVRSNDLPMVEALLAAGADAKIRDRYGLTPVRLACENANATILKRLLDAGTDVN